MQHTGVAIAGSNRPRSRCGHQHEADSTVESTLRASMVRFTRAIQDRNRFREQAQELSNRVRVLETERTDLILNYQNMAAQYQASQKPKSCQKRKELSQPEQLYSLLLLCCCSAACDRT